MAEKETEQTEPETTNGLTAVLAQEKHPQLILYCDRHMIPPQLLAACHTERPRVDWPVFA